MEKTLKQIADDLKIDKQKVYRYCIKNDVLEAHQKSGVKYYDEKAQALINSHFSGEEKEPAASGEALANTSFDVLLKQIDVLQKELDVKNRQIEALSDTVKSDADTIRTLSDALKDAQALHAGTLAHQMALPEKAENSSRLPGWWPFRKK